MDSFIYKTFGFFIIILSVLSCDFLSWQSDDITRPNRSGIELYINEEIPDTLVYWSKKTLIYRLDLKDNILDNIYIL